MTEFKNILVPTDSSEASSRAIAEAVRLNAEGKGTIHLLYVADVNKLAINAYLSGNILLEINRAGDRILSESAKLIPEGMHYTTAYKVGDPAELISEYEEENNIDCIVMGSRGLGWVRGVLLGSVSKYVLEHAKCPVMVVK